MSLDFLVQDIGFMNYSRALEIQHDLFEKRKQRKIGDRLLLVEHSPTITFGSNKESNKLHVTQEELAQKGIEFFQSDRGGGAAYLGPGQLIGYTIMNIKEYGGILNFMKKLEETMILTARDFDIPVSRYDVQNPSTDKPYRATWYRNAGKNYVLCTKGIKVSLLGDDIYTHHGFSLNVNREDKHYFHLIDPCGWPASEVQPIFMSDIVGYKLPLEQVKKKLVSNFKHVFGLQEENYATA
ncbi:lipoyl(octanoyl) transferase LipB [Candidatus Pacearchaeota archaeon]|nr:lipoyl(octanoyl) transferase LipB [Candidatus Pacearchaeota archaeon]